MADDCKEWTDALLESFQISGAEAMKKISSESTRYTMQMLKDGASVVNWFTDMVSLATDGGPQVRSESHWQEHITKI
jgi:hypothetical protein